MKRMLGFLAMAGLMLFGLPAERAQAVSLINPATSAQTKYLSDNLTVEVRHGGRGGGFRGGGFRAGGFRGGHIGRAHFGGRHFGHRHAHFHRSFGHRHYWRARPVVYPYYYGGPRLYCRRVWTDFGPRRICRYRPWWV